MSWVLCVASSLAQYVQGRVTDAATGEPLPTAYVYYEGQTHTATQADLEGNYRIRYRKGKLIFSMMGFETKMVAVSKPQRLDVKLRESSASLDEVRVEAKRKKYSRKDNPAVEMMKKVIAAKGGADLRNRDFLSFRKYEKLTFSLNEFTEKVFQEGQFKSMPFLKDHVEVHPETGKLILPLTVSERITRTLYRRQPQEEKLLIEAERSEGINDLFNTGDIMNVLLEDCITEVDFYQDQVRLLQYPFISPLSTSSAIGFYRYFIVDTLNVGHDRCYRLDFTPNNPQDFGFSGSLYVRADSSWRLRRAEIGIPTRSDVNFVEKMDIVQDFDSLPSGEQLVVENKMILQLKLVDGVQKIMAERVTHGFDYDFSPIPDRLFRGETKTRTEASARTRSDEYWQEQRPVPLSRSEQGMGNMLHKMQGIRGFRPIIWIAKAFIENYVETTVKPGKPNLVDIGPINTMIGSNWVEGFRLRASAQTTANLHRHLFAKGYVKYGFGDQRWKGMGELTYSFNAKEYVPSEFPVNNLTFTYMNDVASPSDKFLSTDKDNVFVAWKWTPVKHMNYFERYNLMYDKEWHNGLRATVQFRHERNEGAGDLFYQPLDAQGQPSADPASHLKKLAFSEATLGLQFRPNASYVNTKQRRLVTNLDAPIFGLQHTMGLKGVFGGEYRYNFTEASVYKRFWMRSWGKLDVLAKAGAQWNKVPYPFLIMPASNLSYIIDTRSFRLIRNMEFLNDRYASAILNWDLNGKLFNRIPLLRELKWRENIGCNVLWGTLTDRNNPYLPQNAGDKDLFYFPGSFTNDNGFEYMTRVMNPHKPYVEIVAGIHNVFKIVRLEYVHRLNYHTPGMQRWGIRGALEFSF